MIEINKNAFALHTVHTTLCFHVLPSRHVEHLYYGTRIRMAGTTEAMNQKRVMPGGNGIAYSREYPLVCLEDLCLEMSSLGHGDVRDPFLELEYGNGSRTSNFLYERSWVGGEEVHI